MFLSSCMSSSRPDLSRIGFGVGWVDWKNFVCRTTSLLVIEQLPLLVVEQLSNPILLSIRDVVRLRSLAEVEVTCILFFVKDFSSFQSNNFGNTISWNCFLKDDCIRSNLIECQSFPQSKIDVDPTYCVLSQSP